METIGTAPRGLEESVQAAADGIGRRLDSARETELGEDARDVVLDRARTDLELLRDLAVLEPTRDQAQHIELARVQLVDRQLVPHRLDGRAAQRSEDDLGRSRRQPRRTRGGRAA